MGSSLEWTVPSLQGLTIRLRGNELSLESLYGPACLRKTLRQIEYRSVYESVTPNRSVYECEYFNRNVEALRNLKHADETVWNMQ